MLLQFKFKNFRSFRNENTLDMTAAKITELSYHIRKVNGKKILPVTAIFGANASGKSNITYAFDFMLYCVQNSFGFDTNPAKTVNSFPYNKSIYYRFTDNKENTSSFFETVFICKHDKKEYTYGFIIDNQGFREEWLKYRKKTDGTYVDIITRTEYTNIKVNTKKNMEENIKVSLKKTTLVLSLGALLEEKTLKKIIDWFFTNRVINLGDPLLDMFHSTYIINERLLDKHFKNALIKYLSSFEPSITDYILEETKQLNNENEKIYNIYTVHNMNKKSEIKQQRLPLSQESSGTQKMFALFRPFYEAITGGNLLIIDELNAKLHPLLTRAVINMFSDPETNPNNAQLIFTTHDAWLLDNNILRRDEIWFTEKNKLEESELYSLVEFKDNGGKKIRKDESYIKNYMLGSYGAIPQLKSFDMFNNDVNNG